MAGPDNDVSGFGGNIPEIEYEALWNGSDAANAAFSDVEFNSAGVIDSWDGPDLPDVLLEGGSTYRPLRRMDQILNQILELIVLVLQKMEASAVVQSKANLLSQDIQRAYTELISQVQLKDTSSIDTEDTQDLEELKSDNEITQKRIEDLRNARTTERDYGKELTDALKSTNDNIEQQSQLGSSILQQLGELIRAIFK